MKKKWLTFVGVAILVPGIVAGTVFAANQIKLVVDDKEIKTDVPVQINKGNIVVPVRQLAEALGASVEWNNAKQTIEIEDLKETQVQQLESALAPKDKLNAATLWAESAKTRNGALRYAILSPELKKKQYLNYKELNWVIGGSSPWVQSYKIVEKNGTDVNTCDYEIDYVLTDSTEDTYSAVENITIKKFNVNEVENWFVVNGGEPSYATPSMVK